MGTRLSWEKGFWVVVGLLCVAAATSAPAVRYVWQGSGDPQQPYDTWNTAAHDIQTVLLFAPADETIIVRAGTYFLSQQINVSSDCTLMSESGDPASTVLHGNGGVRCLNFETSGSTLSGFTITAGETTTDGGGVYAQYDLYITNCVVVSNYVAGNGGGIAIHGGQIADCHIAQNRANNGGGVYQEDTDLADSTIVDNVASNGAAGVYAHSGFMNIQRCIITDNHSDGGPGGIRIGAEVWLHNSLVAGNYAAIRGGGVYAGGNPNYQAQVSNCTLADNSAGVEAGGLYANYGPLIRNTIIYGNEAPTAPEWGGWYAVQFDHVLTRPVPNRDGNIEEPPHFVDFAAGDFHLRPGSPGIDAGMYIGDVSDLDGSDRYVAPQMDMGCYEAAPGSLQVNILADAPSGSPPHNVLLEAAVRGTNVVDLIYYWDLNEDGLWDLFGQGLSTVTGVFASSGSYSVELLVSNAVGEAAQVLKEDWIEVGPAVIYVAGGGLNQPPYTNWMTAATTISSAIEAAVDGSLLILSDEVFHVSAPIHIDKGITLRGLGDRSTSVIDGGQMTRCVELANPNALLESLTIRGGTHREGAGVFISAGGTLSNCVIRDCYATNYGGGVYTYAGGRIQNCLIDSNGCNSTGAGVYLGLLPELSGSTFSANAVNGIGGGAYVEGQGLRIEACSFLTNTASEGAGIYIDAKSTVLTNCLFCANVATDNGGGLYLNEESCRLENSVLTSNVCEGSLGGGMYMAYDGCVVRACEITGNYCEDQGGGIYSEGYPNLFEDCVFDGNAAGYYPGGLYSDCSAVNRCIFKNNRSAAYGGGIYLDGGGMTNCLVVSNSADEGGGIYLDDGEVQNCTVAFNSSTNDGGGIYDSGGEIRNSIVAHNEGPAGTSNYYGSGTWSFSCAQPLPSGTDNLDGDPQFAVRYRIRPPSIAVDAGSDISAPSVDLEGKVRPFDGDEDGTNKFDLGCYEYEPLPIDQDGDGDGVSDLDEIYLYDTLPGNPDSDSDGLDDGDEIAAGTDPNNNEDVFQLTGLTQMPAQDGSVVLIWSSVAGKQYTLSRGTNLVEGLVPLAQHIDAAPPHNAWTTTLAGAEAWFYAIGVEEGP